MGKYFIAIVFTVVIISLTFLNGCKGNEIIIQEPVIDQNIKNESQNIVQLIKIDEQILRLKSELQTALLSGGISPETYKEVDDKIKYYESNGYDKNLTQELRTMLSGLSVGGQQQTIKYNKPIEPNQTEAPTEKSTSPESKIVIWQYREGKWKPNGNPPACPKLLILQMPVNLDLPTSVLYPGQKRSGDFKPHGGFRIDGYNKPVEVRAPLEGYVVNVAKFYDEFGVNYMIDIQNSCGIMNRFGHLGAVPPKIEAIFNDVPTGEYGDSRTHEVKPVFMELGETIATDTQHGSGFDWGVYDLRKENDASQDSAFREAHKDEPYQAYHALCWLDYLPANEQKIIKSLPAADGISGKMSSYC